MNKIRKYLVVVLVLLVLLTGCGKENGNNNSNDGSKLSVVFVVTGQLGDRSFNDSAHEGIKAMAEKLGVETKVIEIGRDQTVWRPTFEDLAEEGEYDIIITNGSNAGELIEEIALEYPEQKFILFDTEMESEIVNLYAISYLQNEASYIAGVLAALVTKSDMEYANEDNKIGFVGGSEHPIITDFLVGYVEGAKSVDPNITVYVSYIGSWDDTAKGKETAMAQYNQGVDIIFPAAEQAGLGCVEAAVEMKKYIIGVDSDQAMLFKGVNEDSANVILTSVLKEVGNSLVRAVDLEQKGNLPWGTFETLGIKEDGVGIARNEYFDKNVPAEIKEEVINAYEQVANGEVKVTSALTDDSKIVEEIIRSVAP
ncbi:MAG: BMP family ABC transporter substrate-binding protein [Erysipelotrichaceae bacterium]|nr:BMP family ABC transporter substrate-binding protein [Erysipelotrichaceae bacterium]